MPATSRPAVYRHFHRFAWLTVALTVCVVVFGAYVRLSDAGMGCPDWPTCYGRAAWPQAAEEAALHTAIEVRPYEIGKAWREQVHRHIAAVLGLMVLGLALLAARRRRLGVARVLVAAGLVAAAIPLYMRGDHATAAALALAGEALLLYSALRWDNVDLSRAAALTLAMIIFQALLGMWTVTWLLKPIVVMAHLLGGLTTFSLLVWMAWRATNQPIILVDAIALRRWLVAGLALLAVQIALGGWVSANYAALSCGAGSWSADNFPRCVGQWWPQGDYREGFVLWRGVGADYEGGVLDGASRIAIQMAHRVMAVVLSLYLLLLGARLLRTPGLRGWAVALLVALALQAGMGILNVKLSLPLALAVGHNAGAVLLLFILVSLLARLRRPA